MDGTIREYPTRHITRTDKEAGVFRMLFKEDEIAFPLCNIRSVRTAIIPDPAFEEQIPPVVDAEKEQKSKDGYSFEIPFIKRGKKE